METQKPSISPLRQRMIEDMRMRKLGDRTQEGYVRAVRYFAKYLGRSPDTATVEDLRNYQLYLVDHETSPTSLNAAIYGLKFFLQRHARPSRADGQNAAGASAAHVAGDPEPGRGEAPDRCGWQPETPNRPGTGLCDGPTNQRSRIPEGHRHRQPAHDPAGRTRQGPEGSLCDAFAVAAGTTARLVAGGPRAGQDARWWLAVPWSGSGPAPQRPATRPRHPRSRRRSRHQQAGIDALAAPCLCHAPLGAEGRHPPDPGPARAQEVGNNRPLRPGRHRHPARGRQSIGEAELRVVPPWGGPPWRSPTSSAPMAPRGERSNQAT